MPARPSNKEICKKVADALAAIEAGRRFIALTKHLVGDLAELELEDEAALWELIPRLLKEIRKADPVRCYAGSRPPQRSYESEIKGEDLWAFRWPSVTLGREMYLKFALKNTKAGWVFAHVDCHEDRPKKG